VEVLRVMMAEARAELGEWNAAAEKNRVDLQKRTDEAAIVLLPEVGGCANTGTRLKLPYGTFLVDCDCGAWVD
jgi:hypothetical protein